MSGFYQFYELFYSQIKDVRNFLAYCFYVPTVFGGPIINYKEFHDGVWIQL